ncbi:MAG: glycosyl hydrolase [Gammaproteobacteria bacterium]|nr:MAG: glycosyl hydrolase [Gammaproteobacteria bacterium]
MRSLLFIPLLLAVSLLCGCEAPLDVSAVEMSKEDPVRRTDFFQDVQVSGDAVVVVGRGGVLLHSGDGGRQWQRQRLEGFPSFIDVTACPDGTFVALDTMAGVWIGTNGGANWERRQIDTEETMQAVGCGPDNRLWAVGSFTTIASSDDLGRNWQVRSLDEDAILNGIQIFDADNLLIVGEFGTLLRSSDGGQSWNRDAEIPGHFYPQDLYFSDREHGWVVGLAGSVLRTEDGGRSWKQERTGTRATLYGIHPVGSELYVVGREGVILRREGEQWTPVDYGGKVRLYIVGLYPADEHEFFVVGQNGYLARILPRSNSVAVIGGDFRGG